MQVYVIERNAKCLYIWMVCSRECIPKMCMQKTERSKSDTNPKSETCCCLRCSLYKGTGICWRSSDALRFTKGGLICVLGTCQTVITSKNNHQGHGTASTWYQNSHPKIPGSSSTECVELKVAHFGQVKWASSELLALHTGTSLFKTYM